MFKDPFVNVIDDVVVKLSCKVQPPPTPLKTTEEPIDILFVVIVLPVVVAAKVIVPPVILKLAEGNVQFPKIDIVLTLKVIAPSNALAPMPKLMLLQTAKETETLNEFVPVLELLSKITSSADVGKPAPPLPPELVAQLVVDDAFHVPVPPTQ